MRTDGITSEKLRQLHELRVERATTAQTLDAGIRALIPPDIWERMEEARWRGREVLDQMDHQASKLETEIRQEVIAYGETVKHPCGMQAVYVRGRVEWDSRALDGYAVAHPEMLSMRREGKPSVRIQWEGIR